jgi:hypothetical protein
LEELFVEDRQFIDESLLSSEDRRQCCESGLDVVEVGEVFVRILER